MKKHLKKAEYNERFLAEVEKWHPNTFFDWKITVVFYIAVHYIDAYLASHKIYCNDHQQRRYEIEEGLYNVTQLCLDNYNNLYRVSRHARYNGFTDIIEFNKYQNEKYKEAKSNLKKIKDFVIDDLEEGGLISS